MNDLFTIAPSAREQRRINDCLRHADEWERIAHEQTCSPRGRILAADAIATANRLRIEAQTPINED